MAQPIVTKASINEAIANANKAFVVAFVGRALVVLFNNQTVSEQASNTTVIDNGVGFAGGDGKAGALCAKYFLKHKTLLDWQLDKWTTNNRLAKYHRQLNAAAQAKERAKQIALM